MAELVCCGECLVDMVPDDRGCFCPHPGGAPANVAVGAARLGLSTAFVGKRGDDAFGEILQRYLEEGGVDTSGFSATREALTALAFIQHREGRVPEFRFYRSPGADELLRPQDFPARLLDGAKVFHFGSISLYSEPSAGATRAAADKVRAHGGLVSYDPNLRPALMETRPGALEAARSAIGRAHVLKASSEELVELSGHPAEERSLTFLFDHGIRLAAITRGPDGATLATADARVDLPSEEVPVVDTTGAGDAFTAALLTGLLERDLGPEDLARLDRDTLQALGHWANRVAALATTQTGATRGIGRPA